MIEKTDSRLRLGFVGGGIGALIGAIHRIAARIDDQYQLVAGALSTNPENNRTSGAEINIAADRIYDDFREMATVEAGREDGIDVVAIVTPNHLHYPIARAFLEQGIHVICDKPLTSSMDDAQALHRLVQQSACVFVLTHNYTAYPLVRHARQMVSDGALGNIRIVQAEYPQDWLSTDLENQGIKQAQWRTDPARSGPSGCLGDIGTHAFNLAAFITGLRVQQLSADLHTFVNGRALDDNAQIMLRYANGARGAIWASQVAPGNANGLKIRVYGEKGGLEWRQEEPNNLLWSALGEPTQIINRSGPGTGDAAAHATRTPPGHPEGYLEGFAQIYLDAAEQIRACIEQRQAAPGSLLIPGIDEGVEGMRFIDRVLESSAADGRWVDC